eukprot:GHVR01080138.1.p1 GENE.GHVR01080138.1~~GHVR01080138.1.p1  ORF type:complete len:151 (+),score=12.27 GHVR01080138.1:1390-1842(+)
MDFNEQTINIFGDYLSTIMGIFKSILKAFIAYYLLLIITIFLFITVIALFERSNGNGSSNIESTNNESGLEQGKDYRYSEASAESYIGNRYYEPPHSYEKHQSPSFQELGPQYHTSEQHYKPHQQNQTTTSLEESGGSTQSYVILPTFRD